MFAMTPFKEILTETRGAMHDAMFSLMKTDDNWPRDCSWYFIAILLVVIRNIHIISKG